MEKEDPNQVQAILGGYLVHYPEDVGTPTADLLLIKLFFNSIVLTNRAKFATTNISNLYRMIPLKHPEYGKVKLSDIPQEIIDKYKLHENVIPDGWVYFKVI
jgi:hypothetical protein